MTRSFGGRASQADLRAITMGDLPTPHCRTLRTDVVDRLNGA